VQHQGACRSGHVGYNPTKAWIDSGLHETGDTKLAVRARHTRPTVAKWFQDLSLGARLSFFVALIVLGVVTSVAYLEVQSYEDYIRHPVSAGMIVPQVY